MCSSGHDIGSDDGALDHLSMNLAVIAAGMAVPAENGVVSGGEKRSRAAGKVGDGEGGVYLEIFPVGAQASNGHFCKQSGAGWQGVERCKEISGQQSGSGTSYPTDRGAS